MLFDGRVSRIASGQLRFVACNLGSPLTGTVFRSDLVGASIYVQGVAKVPQVSLVTRSNPVGNFDEGRKAKPDRLVRAGRIQRIQHLLG